MASSSKPGFSPSPAPPPALSTETLHRLILSFLASHYPQTHKALESEIASLSPSLSSALSTPEPSSSPLPDLREVVEDYLARARAAREAAERPSKEFEEQAEDVLAREPDEGKVPRRVGKTLEAVHVANVLCVRVWEIARKRFDTGTAEYIEDKQMCVVSSAADRTVKITDLETGEVEHIFEPHRAPALSLALHPTKPHLLLSGGMDGSIAITDLQTRSELFSEKGHAKFVVRVAFSPCGRYFASASYDRTIRIYSSPSSSSSPSAHPESDALPTYTHLHTLTLPSNPETLLYALLPSPPPPPPLPPSSTPTPPPPAAPPFSTPTLALIHTCRADNHLHYLLLPSLLTLKVNVDYPRLESHVSFSILDLSLHPSGKYLLAQTGDHAGSGLGRVLVFPVMGGERVRTVWTGVGDSPYSTPRHALSPCGTLISLASDDGLVRTYALADGKLRSTVRAHGLGGAGSGEGESAVVRDLAYVPDGSGRVVTGGYDKALRVLVPDERHAEEGGRVREGSGD